MWEWKKFLFCFLSQIRKTYTDSTSDKENACYHCWREKKKHKTFVLSSCTCIYLELEAGTLPIPTYIHLNGLHGHLTCGGMQKSGLPELERDYTITCGGMQVWLTRVRAGLHNHLWRYAEVWLTRVRAGLHNHLWWYAEVGLARGRAGLHGHLCGMQTSGLPELERDYTVTCGGMQKSGLPELEWDTR
jgi:hypothetical protein